MAIEALTHEYLVGGTVPVPIEISNGLITNDATRSRLQGKKGLSMLDEARFANAREQFDLAVVDFLEFRSGVIGDGMSVSDATLEVGRYYNPDYSGDLPPSEIITPFSNPRLFIELSNPNDPKRPHFFITQTRHLVKTGLVGKSDEVINNHLSHPDGYRNDTPEQYMNRMSLEVHQLNGAFTKSEEIIDPVQKKDNQDYIKALQGWIGESIFILNADPSIDSPKVSVEFITAKGSTKLQHLLITVGNNNAFRLSPQLVGPSGLTMLEIAQGRAAHLVDRYKLEGIFTNTSHFLDTVSPISMNVVFANENAASPDTNSNGVEKEPVQITVENAASMLQEVIDLDAQIRNGKDTGSKDASELRKLAKEKTKYLIGFLRARQQKLFGKESLQVGLLTDRKDNPFHHSSQFVFDIDGISYSTIGLTPDSIFDPDEEPMSMELIGEYDYVEKKGKSKKKAASPLL